MTGFGVDIGQVSALPGKLSGIGESITGAAGAISGAGQGEFGHPQLNQAVSQLTELLHGYLSGLGQSTSGIADHLTSTVQSYAGTDSSNAGSLGGLPAGATNGVTGAVSGVPDGTTGPAGPTWTASPIQDFGTAAGNALQGTQSPGQQFGLGNSPLAE